MNEAYANVVLQAVRLVKNSIIAIESPEAEVDDVDFVDDLDEIHDVVERFRRSEQIAAHRPPDQQPSQGKISGSDNVEFIHRHHTEKCIGSLIREAHVSLPMIEGNFQACQNIDLKLEASRSGSLFSLKKSLQTMKH